MLIASRAAAQAPPPEPPTPAAEPPVYETVVTPTTPLHGSGLPLDHVPANVQSVTSAELAERHSLDLSGYMAETVTSVSVNDVQANPLQPDLEYRGFLVSPLLGTPQGLSMYLDGMRLNSPFGDTINWDLLPTNAIRSVNLIPGSNPVFGLNTLGGALSLETKTGFSDPGADASLLVGSWGRKLGRVSAGAHGDRFGVFGAAQVFDETGWRDHSPSRAQHALLSTSYENGPAKADLVLAAVNTNLTGNGPVPEQLLAQRRAAIFTSPDQTKNQLLAAILRGERPLAAHLQVSGTAYARWGRTRTLNGDQRAWAECMATPGVLCSADDAPVLDAAGNPVPFSDTFDAAANRTDTRQLVAGVAGQLAVDAPVPRLGWENHLFVGADASQGRVRFRSTTTVASLDANRATVDAGFLDPASPVAVDSTVSDLGVYASDTVTPLPHLYVVVSGRFNLTALSLRDQLGDELTGDHTFQRFNPAVGMSYQPRPWLGGYWNYSVSSRAPTPVELTCANPDAPCRLPNAFLSDPPLAQVVAHTVEVGVRGAYRRQQLKLDYAAAAFQTTNTNDIIFISSGVVANNGYFTNVGDTRRQGVEAQVSARRRVGAARLEARLSYTFLDATFETPFSALSATHPDAVNGAIDVAAGARLPAIPRHLGKLGLRAAAAFGLSGGLDVVAAGDQVLRGDEANLLPRVPGYVVLSARLAYQFAAPVSLFVLANNLLDTRFSTFGVLGDPAEVLGPAYDSPRFLGPGAPRAAWIGADLRY